MGASGLRPLVTARVMRAWRFSASRSSSARFFSISPSIRAVFSSRNRAIRRWVSSGGGRTQSLKAISNALLSRESSTNIVPFAVAFSIGNRRDVKRR